MWMDEYEQYVTNVDKLDPNLILFPSIALKQKTTESAGRVTAAPYRFALNVGFCRWRVRATNRANNHPYRVIFVKQFL